MTLPIRMTQHHDRLPARHPIVVLAEHAPNGRLHSEHLKIITGNEFARGAIRLAVIRHARRKSVPCQNAGKDRIVVAQPLVHRVGEGFGVIAVTRNVSRCRPRRAQHHQFVRVLHRELLQQNLVHQREDRRIRANAQCQRNHGNRREARALRQHPQPKRDVFPHVLHYAFTPALLSDLRRLLRAPKDASLATRFEYRYPLCGFTSC